MSEESYKFRSEITKSILPMGVISINQIQRSEVSPFLMRLKKAAQKEFWQWGGLYFDNCIGEIFAWHEKTILQKMEELKSDIHKLTELLYVKEGEL